MQKITLAAIACAAAALAAGARAADDAASAHHFTANVGVYSQYVFRGLTQSNERPAVQGGFDYTHDGGFYAGTWLSNVSWFADTNAGNSSSLEWDGYLGFRNTLLPGVTADVGYLRYEYPGSYPALPTGTVKPDTDEIYLGLSWRWASLKYSHGVSDLFGVEDSDGGHYLDLTITVPVRENLSLALHAGQQSFEGASAYARLAGTDNDALYGYEDYRATLSYSFGAGWSASASLTQSTAEDAGYTVLGKNLGDDQIIVAVSRLL
jgi:uncharacterized protein (TIGR02001 family)